jgi:CubicO group peptidase (beta-lactamase class C family)
LSPSLVAETAGAQGPRVDTAKIDAMFQSLITKDSPGCAVATIRNSKVEYARGYGMADVERQVPITPKSIFNLASVSKQFTAEVNSGDRVRHLCFDRQP